MLVALLVVIGSALGAFYQGTDGFQALTTETARRLAIAHQPRRLPAATIEFASGRQISLAQALHEDGRITIVNFIYTRCTAICSVMGTEFQQLQQTMDASGMQHKVRLLSISFDPADTPAQLRNYAQQMHAQENVWEFASVPDPRQRQALLDTFGITVIPAPLDEFQHNAAFHIVNPDGMLSRVVDFDAPNTALELAGEAAAQHLAGVRPAGRGGVIVAPGASVAVTRTANLAAGVVGSAGLQ